MRSRRTVPAAAGALALILAACGGSSGSSSGPTGPTGPITVGALFALTGPASPFGIARLNGMQTAVHDINAAGGVLGQQIKVVVANTGGDPVDAVTAARQLIAVNNPAMVEGLTVVDWQNALTAINSQKVVLMAHIPAPDIDQTLYPYMFRCVPSDGLEGAAMAFYAAKKGYKNIALAFDPTQQAQTLVPSLLSAAKKLNLNVVANPSLPVGAPSFATEAQQIVQAQPDVLISQLEPQLAGQFFHQLDQLGGSNIPVIASDTSTTAEWINSVGAATVAKNFQSVIPATQPGGPGSSAFFDVYKQLYNAAPRSNSANGYDCMTVAALAMQAAQSIDPKVFVNFIPQVTSPGSGVTDVYTYADGLNLLKQGKKIKYFGIASAMTYDKYHAITSPFQAVSVAVGGQQTVLADISSADLATVG